MRNSTAMKMSVREQVRLLHKARALRVEGQDRGGRPLLSVVGKLLPGGSVRREGVQKYMEENVLPGIGEREWSLVYIHTGVVQGVCPLRSLYDAIPHHVKHNLKAFYFLHPDLPSRLFFAAFGRFLFGSGVYQKLKYVDRVEFLWEHVRRTEMKIPGFVHDHDKELECRPALHFHVDTDPPSYYASPFIQTSLPFYSSTFIA